MQLRAGIGLVLAMVVAATFAAAAGTQAGRVQEADVLGALLAEVRGLRAAMEQMATAGPRVQLALGRLQLQEQRVGAMIRRAGELRDEIARSEKELGNAQAQLASIRTVAPKGAPEELADMVRNFEAMAAAGAADLERLRSEEAVLQQQIGAEQARWTDINRAVEELEQALGNRR